MNEIVRGEYTEDSHAEDIEDIAILEGDNSNHFILGDFENNIFINNSRVFYEINDSGELDRMGGLSTLIYLDGTIYYRHQRYVSGGYVDIFIKKATRDFATVEDLIGEYIEYDYIGGVYTPKEDGRILDINILGSREIKHIFSVEEMKKVFTGEVE